jgi:N-methylhydantoinase A
MKYVIGVDVGGTFTDAVAADEHGNILGGKAPSTPENYAVGFIDALSDLATQLGLTTDQLIQSTEYIAHGTTSSLNALVTGTVDPVGFMTTKGHGDSIFIMNVEGRYLGLSTSEKQDSLHSSKPRPLVAKSRVFEITERIDQAGEVLVALNEDDVRAAVNDLAAHGVRAVAVSLLWSFRNPAHELRIREIIHEIAPEMFVSLSCEVSPRIREFSRNATTILNTQLGPPLRRYLQALEGDLRERGMTGPLLIMQSSGGTISAHEAPASAITTVGSVLAGGVIGAARLAEQLGHRNVVATDVGGTTFLVGMVVDGEPIRSPNSIITRHPVNVPTVRVEAIGSGGGAIAWVSEGRNLRVGPRSAAAVPGPAAYGTGGSEPTVTDANIVLGIINPEYFLGGRRTLHRELAEQAILAKVGKPLGLDAEAAAAAIFEVQNSQTADLARKVVVEAGYDPRDFVVYAFGGAGPIHASAFAADLGASELVIPLGEAAAGFSAYGLAASDVVVSAELSDPAPYPVDAERVDANFRKLDTQVREALARQGLDFSDVKLIREFDARYASQMVEVTAPAPAGDIDQSGVASMARSFETRYRELFGAGTGSSSAAMQFITYQARGIGRLGARPRLPSHQMSAGEDASKAIKTRRPVFLDVTLGFEDTAIYDYAKLRAGHVIEGPAVIEVPTTTVTIPRGRTARIDELGNVRINLS